MTRFGNASRRKLLKYTIAGLLTLCFIQVADAQVVPVPETVRVAKNEGTKPRNVVFILSDDHRYDAMSFMGHGLAKTPHMDAMAKNGAHLKNAFVTTSLCSPSRASILTGLYTFRHRVIDNQRAVPDGTLFFPLYLQKAGYKTGFIGKWHMGRANDNPRPGFDYWFSFIGQGQYYPPGPQYTINGPKCEVLVLAHDETSSQTIDESWFLAVAECSERVVRACRSAPQTFGRDTVERSLPHGHSAVSISNSVTSLCYGSQRHSPDW